MLIFGLINKLADYKRPFRHIIPMHTQMREDELRGALRRKNVSCESNIIILQKIGNDSSLFIWKWMVE